MFTRSTTASSRAGNTRRTLPFEPRSLPEITRTWSFFLIFVFFITCPRSRGSSDDFRRQRDDLHELLLSELTRDRPEHAGSDRLAVVVDQNRRVRVEAD